MLPRLPLRALGAAVLLALASSAAEAQTPYTSKTDFLAAFTGTGENDLEGVAIPDPPGAVAPVSGLAFGGLTTATLDGPLNTPDFPSSALVMGSALPSQVWSVSDGGITRLTFASTVRGFGADFFDLASIDDVVFRFYLGGSAAPVREQLVALNNPAYEGFYGVDAGVLFDRLDIESTSGEFYEMDNLVVGVGPVATIPEPGTVALVAGGLTLLGAVRRRRAAGAR